MVATVEPLRNDRLLASFGLALAALVFVVVAASAWLRLAEAAGGGADLARFAHRLSAMAAAVMALVIAAIAWRRRPALAAPRALAFAIVALVVGLSALGVVTAGAKLPSIALGNLAGGLALFALAWALQAGARHRARPAAADTGASRWVGIALAVLAVETALGAATATGVIEPTPGMRDLHRVLGVLLFLVWIAFASGFLRLPPPALAAARFTALLTGVLVALGMALAGPGLPPVGAWLHNLATAAAIACALTAWIEARSRG